MSRPRKTMGNKPPTSRCSSNSPSLTSFGFSRKKRSGMAGDEDTPPKRAKSTVKLETTEDCGAVHTDYGKVVVDLTQSSSGDSVSVQSAVDPKPKRRGQRARIPRVDDQPSHDRHQPASLSNSAPSPVSPPTKSTLASPGRIPLRPVNALGLVRVNNPNHILCTTAVAKARRSSSSPDIESIYRIFPGATLGRTSNSSHKDPTFVDIGIPCSAKGVSRRHLKVLSMHGMGNDDRGGDEHSVLTARSNASTASLGSNVAGGAGPTLLLQVLPHPHPPKTTVKVIIHRTRRNQRRTLELKQMERKTLRIGDAIEFLSDVNLYYCLVGFHLDDDDRGSDRTQEMESGASDDAVKIESKLELCDDGRCSETRPILTMEGDSRMTSEMTQQEDGMDVERDETEFPTSRNGLPPTQQVLLVAKGEIKTESIGPSVRESAATARRIESTIITKALSWNTTTNARSDPSAAARAPTGNKSNSSSLASINYASAGGLLSGSARAANTTSMDELLAASSKPPVKAMSELDCPAAVAKKERDPDQTPIIKKGDTVRMLYQISDAFGHQHEVWHYGSVGLVRINPSRGTRIINVALGSGEIDTFDYPHPEVQKVDDISKLCSIPLNIGDFVECKFQDYKWYHGRVTDLSEDGTTCEVLYHDKDLEINIPTDQNKVRLAMPCPSNYEWLIGKPTLIGRKGDISSVEATFRGELCVVFNDGSQVSIPCDDVVRGNGVHLLSSSKPPKRKNASYEWLIGETVLIGRKGVIRDVPRDSSSSTFRVAFEDGSVESISRDEVVTGAFSCLLQGVGIDHQYVWPGSEKFQNNKKDQTDAKSKKESTEAVHKRYKKVCTKRASVQFEDVDGDDSEAIPLHRVVFGTSLCQKCDEEREAGIADVENDLDDPGAEFRFMGRKKIALNLPPGIPNMLWHALNCPEAKTGANMLHEFLCVYDRVPGQDLIRKFWQLILKGPKADGHNVYFKEPFMTELASQYIYELIYHGKRLIRSDGSTLFGPSEWSDIESLLSQSIDQTENMVAGKRLADGLHLSARGSKVLHMMMKYELHDVNTMSVLSNSFDTMPLHTMPTVKLFRHHSRGIREAVKSVVKHTTKCLVMHSRFILDIEDFHPESQSCKENFYDDSCRIESRECFSHLANVVCYSAFLFCISEKVPLNDQAVLLLIRDEFEKELHRCLDDAPEMDKTSTNNFVRTMKETFLTALSADFAMPLFVGLAKMMGFEKELRLLGCIVD